MPRRPLCRTVPALVALAVAATLGFTSPASQAAPEGPVDGMLDLLREKGLAPIAAAAASVGPNAEQALERVQRQASEVVISALNYIGVQYRRGGDNAESGFDCSGFTRYVYNQTLGLVLPRSSIDQAHATGLKEVKADELQPGDLVFFNTLRRTFSHVGIYIGEGRFVHSPRTGAQVRVEELATSYWARRFNGARRVELAQAPATPGGHGANSPAASPPRP